MLLLLPLKTWLLHQAIMSPKSKAVIAVIASFLKCQKQQQQPAASRKPYRQKRKDLQTLQQQYDKCNLKPKRCFLKPNRSLCQFVIRLLSFYNGKKNEDGDVDLILLKSIYHFAQIENGFYACECRNNAPFLQIGVYYILQYFCNGKTPNAFSLLIPCFAN